MDIKTFRLFNCCCWMWTEHCLCLDGSPTLSYSSYSLLITRSCMINIIIIISSVIIKDDVPCQWKCLIFMIMSGFSVFLSGLSVYCCSRFSVEENSWLLLLHPDARRDVERFILTRRTLIWIQFRGQDEGFHPKRAQTSSLYCRANQMSKVQKLPSHLW